jgi:hypothetical protein
MLAVRSAVPATYVVPEFVEIGEKFCGADRSPLQADSSTGSSTEVSDKKCRWLLACRHFSLSSNSVSRGRFGAQFLRAAGERSPLGEGVPPGGGPRPPHAAQGPPCLCIIVSTARILLPSKPNRYYITTDFHRV